MGINTADYWNERLNQEFSLKGVGYANFSRFYNNWLYKRKSVVFNSLASNYFPDSNGKDVLDIGCGTGFFIHKYLKLGAKVNGIDITDISVRNLSKKYPQGKFHVLDLSAPAGKLDEQFDIINMWDVMYHIVDDQAFERACKNVADMSRKNSLFIMTDMLGSEIDFIPASHVKFRNLDSYKKVLVRLGFQLMEVVPLYRYLNRPYSWGTGLTNTIAPLLYLMDKTSNRVMPRNLSVGVWKYA